MLLSGMHEKMNPGANDLARFRKSIEEQILSAKKCQAAFVGTMDKGQEIKVFVVAPPRMHTQLHWQDLLIEIGSTARNRRS